jgi:alpha-mannosidase
MKRTLLGLLVLCCVGSAVMARSTPSGGTKVLWRIGQSGGGNAGLGLAPDGWRRYSEDGYFIADRSSPAAAWPYVHPGPDDRWAGSRQHTFTVIFGVKDRASTGSCILRFELLDTHSQAPPALRVRINGRDFDRTLPAGGGDESLNGRPEKGKAHAFSMEFPADLLRRGNNEIGITTVSGSWFLYGSLALEAPEEVTQAPVGTEVSVVSAKALPVAKEMNGRVVQVLRLTLNYTGDTAEAVLRLPGADSSRLALTAGVTTADIPVPAVERDSVVMFTVQAGARTVSGKASIAPVRRMTIYVLPHSHTDIGYTEIQSAIEKKQVENLLTGIRYARSTSGYPEGARFVWNVEVLWAADLYFRRLSEDQKREFLEAVSKGWIGLNGMYLNELTGLCRPEELLRLFRFSTVLAERCSTTVDAAMISDVPGYTWGTVTAMAQSGIRYFSVAPNYSDRIGDILVQWENRPFYWMSPSGKEKVLVWIPLKGYAMSHIVGSLSDEFVSDYMGQLARAGYPYDIAYIRWSGHGDNAVPDSSISGFIRQWNVQYAWPKFIIASTSTAFRAFEQRYGESLPRVRGDWTPYWEDGAGSSALETAMNRASADRLTQSEALWAVNDPAGYPADEFDEAWRNALLYSEHTWGAWCSVSDPENQATKEQWEIKRSYATEADRRSKELLARGLASGAQRAASGGAVDVYNTSSWPRTELIMLPKDLPCPGDRVVDDKGRSVPSQRLSSGELAFVATGVQPFSKRRYRLQAGKALRAGKASAGETGLANGILDVRIDGTRGGITGLYIGGLHDNLADTSSGYAINDYLYLPGDSLRNLARSGPVTVRVKEPGPLVSSLVIESAAPGARKLTRELRLVSGFDYVELINTVDKTRAAVSDKPGNWEFAQKGGKEGVNFAFPFNVPSGVMNLDIPLGVIRPEADQMPSACKNWFTVGRWADVSNGTAGVTWVTLDAPLVEVGGITATLPGSQSDPSAWRKHVAPTQELFSWAMNNHWHTNYRAYQEGPVVFRYVLRPHGAFAPDEASRFAASFSQPLIAVTARGRGDVPSRLVVEPKSVVVLSMKPSDDRKALIVRLFGASGRAEMVKLHWAKPVPAGLWLSGTGEKPLKMLEGPFEVPAWEVVTVRAELGTH